MSVPPERMAVRSTGDPNKIMGVRKPIFYVIVGLGLIFAIWLYLRSRNTKADVAAGTGPVDNTQGLTAADIGGTPADNSFATQTDQTALEEQIQQLQNSMSALQDSNGGNGAGITAPRRVDPTVFQMQQLRGSPGVINFGGNSSTPTKTPVGII